MDAHVKNDEQAQPAQLIAALTLYAGLLQARGAAIAAELRDGEVRRTELIERVRCDGRLSAEESTWLERHSARLTEQMALEELAHTLRRATDDLLRCGPLERLAAAHEQAGEQDEALRLRSRAGTFLKRADELVARLAASEPYAERVAELASASIDTPRAFEQLDEALATAMARLNTQIGACEAELAVGAERHQGLMRTFRDGGQLAPDDLTWCAQYIVLDVVQKTALLHRRQQLVQARRDLEDSQRLLHGDAEQHQCTWPAHDRLRASHLFWRGAVPIAQELDPQNWLD